MKFSKLTTPISVAAFCTLLTYSCTSNPFGSNEISGGPSTITGTVSLGSNSSSTGAYVWLDGLGVGTKTDENGRFSLALPPPSAQGNSNGTTGTFDLYYYVANFRLNRTELATRNGFFVLPNQEFDEKGELHLTKSLFQFLTITTEIQPCSLQVGLGGLMTARFILEAKTDSVTVFFPGQVDQYLYPVLLHNLQTGQLFIKDANLTGVAGDDWLVVGRQPYSRRVLVSLRGNTLPRGEYQVIPYLLVRHDQVPAELLTSLGKNVEALGPEYLKIPFVREGQSLVIY